ncbi:MAG TPA: MerR family transcriptional regulator [Candidatus Pullichristensenella excrementipullorum]|nr:MerR family transcriptional regulator [Candidatus Pullichristensenella excrementipullorum]
MKDSYTIHEIASLYGVGTDALRYYERLGLVKPRRGENGYRIYDLNDIYRLTIIRDLRSLGFSMERIGEYLKDLSVANTLQLLDEERRLIREKMRALRAAEGAIRARVRHLQACAAVEDGGISLVELPPRPCLRLNADIARDEEMDFAIKRLHRRHEDTIRDLGGQKIGASIAPEDIRAGKIGLYRSVFFLLDEGATGDLTLPGGRYACLYYRGSYRQLGARVAELFRWARKQGLSPTGDVLELYPIDDRFTAREEEFLTQLQVRVEPGAPLEAH